MLALGVREAMVHRALIASMARVSASSSTVCTSQTPASIKLALLESIVENSLVRGDAAGAAAVLYHSMDVAEAQSRAVAEE